jgi:hypothetical protein
MIIKAHWRVYEYPEEKRKLYTENQKKARWIKRQLEIKAYIWQKKREIQLKKELNNN